MLVEWDVPITMDDGVVLRANVFRPDDDAPHPVLLSYGPYGKDLAFPGRLPRRVDEDGRRPSGRGGGVVEPLSGVGGVRSGEVGAGRIHLRAGRRPRVGPLTGLHRYVRDAGHPGHVRLHRVGGHPAVEHRQSRPARHQLLRDHAVAGGRPEPAPPDRDGPVGRRQRFLPRHVLPRWDALPGRRRVVPPHHRHRAAWTGRTQLRQRQHRGARHRSGDTDRRGTCGQPSRLRRRRAKPSARRRFSSGALCGVRPDHGAVPVGGQLGRRRAAPPRQCRGVRARGVEPEVAGDPRPRALDRVLHRLRNRFAEAVFRPLPQRHRQRLGPPATGHAADPHRRRRLHRPHRKRMAHRPHPVDDLAPRPRHGHPLARPAFRARLRRRLPHSTAPASP